MAIANDMSYLGGKLIINVIVVPWIKHYAPITNVLIMFKAIYDAFN